jgi:ATP-binding cassette subfamily B protein
MLGSIRRVFFIYTGYRGRLILSQVSLLISATATIGVATLNQRLINDGLLAGDALVIINVGIWMLLLAIIGGATLALTAALAVFFAQGTAFYIRSELYAKIQSFSFANFDHFRTGNLMVRLNTDVVNVANAVQYMVLLLLYAPFMLIVAYGLVILRTPELLWVLILITVVVSALMAILVPQIFKNYDQRQQRLDELNNTLQENLAGVRVVKAFVREELEVQRFAARSNSMRVPAFGAAFRVALLNPLLTATAQLGIALAIWVGGGLIIDQAGFSVGELVTFMQYVGLVITPLALLAIVVPFILRGDASAERILEVLRIWRLRSPSIHTRLRAVWRLRMSRLPSARQTARLIHRSSNISIWLSSLDSVSEFWGRPVLARRRWLTSYRAFTM